MIMQEQYAVQLTRLVYDVNNRIILPKKELGHMARAGR
jgi:hypothetical protein